MAFDPKNLKLIGYLPPVPQLDLKRLAEDEQTVGRQLNYVLWDLGQHVGLFKHAVELFVFCRRELMPLIKSEDHEARDRLMRWQFIAAQDAVMTVYHFSMLLSRVMPTARLCPTVWANTQQARLKQARTLFRGRFPNADDHRHAIGHAGEQELPYIFANELKPGPLRTLRGAIVGNAFQTTHHDGRIFQCRIDMESLARLEGIKEEAYAGIWPAIEIVAALPEVTQKAT